MSFDWREHAECLAAKPPGDLPRGTGPCKADRAAMIAEGERLQCENARLREALHALQAAIVGELNGIPNDLKDQLYKASAALSPDAGRDFEARIRADERAKWDESLNQALSSVPDSGVSERIFRLRKRLIKSHFDVFGDEWNQAVAACERKMDEVIYGGLSEHTRTELRKLKRDAPK